MKNAIVMAAGKGTRMHSDLPKVLHEVCGMPMAEMIVHQLKKAGAERIVTITGYGHEQVEKALAGQCEFALQEPQLGTGHAVMQAKQLEGEKGLTVVANGDCPGVRAETYAKLYEIGKDADMAVLTVVVEDAASYGRIVRDSEGNVEKIVEFKDCNEEQKKIWEVNTGIYVFNNEALFEGLKDLKDNNAQHEYYITDLIEILRGKGKVVKAVTTDDAEEVQGVNDNYELAKAGKTLQKRINAAWMKSGVGIVDPDTAYIGPEVTFGKDVVVEPNTRLYGKCEIGSRCRIGSETTLRNTVMEDGSCVDACRIENSTVKAGQTIKPYSHIVGNVVVE